MSDKGKHFGRIYLIKALFYCWHVFVMHNIQYSIVMISTVNIEENLNLIDYTLSAIIIVLMLMHNQNRHSIKVKRFSTLILIIIYFIENLL